MLNSTFIQGLELDDYHSKAPIHSGSIIVPVLLALTEHLSQHASVSKSPEIDGAAVLVAAIVGYELGPRIGLGLYGTDVLTNGWHSGAIFGPAAAAATASKLLLLPADQIEDAIGTACTQACGLMSAQYESMVKRMQHGFAARSGLFAAFMAANGYKGIKQVLERPYGGFLSQFSRGSERNPPSRPEAITTQLGREWEIEQIVVKPYATMAATHVPIDCIRILQEENPMLLAMQNLHNISGLVIEMPESGFKKGGWKAKRPITMTGAQMNASYAVALQLLDRKVTAAQFLQDASLDRPDLWALVDKVQCLHNPDFDAAGTSKWTHRVTVSFNDTFGQRKVLQKLLHVPRSHSKPPSNEEILEKWRATTNGILTDREQQVIEMEVLNLEKSDNAMKLVELIMRAGRVVDAEETTSSPPLSLQRDANFGGVHPSKL